MEAVEPEVQAPANTSLDTASVESGESFGDYRSMSTLAMASFGLGLLSVLSLISLVLGIIPLMGMALGVKAWLAIRSNPAELTGESFAKLGVVLSALFMIGGWVIAGVEYATEVPEGFNRISYAALQSEDPTNPIPQSAKDLQGQAVFVKGYMYQGQSQQKGIKKFILCRDNGACCFGGPKPKLNDMIQVNMVNGERTNYSAKVFKIAGTFRVEPQMSDEGDIGQVLYAIDAEYVK